MSECDSKVGAIMFGCLLALSENRYKPETTLIQSIFYTARERESRKVTLYMKIKSTLQQIQCHQSNQKKS